MGPVVRHRDGVGDGVAGAAVVVCVDFTTERSAVPLLGTASGGALPVSLPPLLSSVSLVALALLLMGPVAFAVSCTTSVKTAVVPLAIEAVVQVTVPFAPTAGVVQLKPAGTLIDWKSSPAGSVSVTTTFAAASGPLFVSVIV